MKRLIIATLILLAPAALSACHTVHGVGRDVSAVGHGISNTAGTHN